MARLLSFLFALIGGIVLVVLVGTIFLPVVAGILIVWFLMLLLSPSRGTPPPEPEPDADVPASQAVIDVQAVEVTDDEPAREPQGRR